MSKAREDENLILGHIKRPIGQDSQIATPSSGPLGMGSALSSSTSQLAPAMPPPGKSLAAFANVCPTVLAKNLFADDAFEGLLLGYASLVVADR
jgi:hypothetical protein